MQQNSRCNLQYLNKLQISYIFLQQWDIAFSEVLYFCIRFQFKQPNIQAMSTLTQILIIALATAFVVVVLLLMVAIIYYRWRLRDSHRTHARFIRESLEMEYKGK